MLTPRDSKLSRNLREWLLEQIAKAKDNVINGLEHDSYIKLCAQARAYGEVLKELDAIEKAIRED